MNLWILMITIVILVETSFLVGFVVWKQQGPRRGGQRKIYVDTSALIDGRIMDIARTGFISDDLVILKSVLRELQLLADGKDAERRNRARMGLEVAAELERIVEINTEVVDDAPNRRVQVDEELLKFAKANHGAILTMDYNLIKVAAAENIATLNINDLAMAVRSEFLVGEKVRIRITERGTNRGQGVGYLSDGTMVVVDQAAHQLNQEVEVELTKFHETSAGRIVFAKIVRQNN